MKTSYLFSTVFLICFSTKIQAQDGLKVASETTKIIPDHGNLSDKLEYETFLSMLETLKNAVLSEIKTGKRKMTCRTTHR